MPDMDDPHAGCLDVDAIEDAVHMGLVAIEDESECWVIVRDGSSVGEGGEALDLVL